MVVEVQAFTRAYDGGLYDLAWVDISTVRYVTGLHKFSQFSCNTCIPHRLRLTENHVEETHYINGQLVWGGWFISDTLVQGLPIAMPGCTPVSDCGTTYPNTHTTSMLPVGGSEDIPNSPYTLKVTKIYCDAPSIVDNYATVEIYKSGTLVATCNYYIGGDYPTTATWDSNKIDGGAICIHIDSMDCGTTPTKVGFDVYYTAIVNSFEVTVNNIAANGVAILAATPWSGILGDICVLGYCLLNNFAQKDIPAPVPVSKVLTFTEADGLVVGKRYVFYAANYVLGLPVPKIYEAESKLITMQTGVNKVTINGYAETLPWESWICGLFGVADIDCAQAVRTFGADFIYSAESWSLVRDKKHLDGTSGTPGTLDYIFCGLDMLPLVGGGGKFAVKIGDKVLSGVGGKIAEIAITTGKKGEIAAWMNSVGVENLAYTLARVTDAHTDELLKLLREGNFPAATAWVSKYFPTPDFKATKATVKSFSDQINYIYDIFRGEGDNVVREVKAGEALSKAAAEVAVDYADDVVKLRNFYKEAVDVKEIVRIDDIVTKNPTEWLKVLNPATGISLSDLHLVEGLVTSGNATKLKNAGKLDGFLTRFTNAVSLQPSKYREIMKAYSDAEIKAISDELIAIGKVDEAQIYRLSKAADVVTPQGVEKFTAKVAGEITQPTTKVAAEATAKVIHDGVEEGAKKMGAAEASRWTGIFNTIKNNVLFSKLGRYLEKDTKATEYATKLGVPGFWELPLWAKVSVAVGIFYGFYSLFNFFKDWCFPLFIGEETLQTGQFAGFAYATQSNDWYFLTLTEKQALIKNRQALYEARKQLHDAVVAGAAIPQKLCIFFGGTYQNYWDADTLNLDAFNKETQREIDSIAGLPTDVEGYTTLIVSANRDAVDVWAEGYQIIRTGKAYDTYYLDNIKVLKTNYDVAVMASKSGYKTAIQTVTITPADIGKKVTVALLELAPKTAISPTIDPDLDPDPTEVTDYGKISCTSTIPGLKIFVDNKDTQHTTPWVVEWVAVGSHTVDFKTTVNALVCSVPVTVSGGTTAQASCECSYPIVGISWTPTDVKVNTSVTFLGSVSEAEAAKMKKWEWDFGDGTGVVTGQTIPHTFTKDGTFTVKLTVTNECDKLFSYSKTVTVSKALGTINCLCTGDYCARGMDIYIDGVIQGLKTTDKPYYRSFDVAPGTHTVEYNLVDVLKGSQSVTVAAGETKAVDIAPVGVLDPSQVGVTTTVTAIEDGDTIRTALTEALPAKPSIRMTGYDAPESGTTEGINATDYLKALIPVGSTITLKVWKQLPLDIYNRVLGGAFVGTKDISLEMLKSCLVKRYTAHDKFYWIDWAMYDSLYCDNTLYGSMTVKAYDADKNLITGVKVFVDDIDKGDAPITVNSLLAGAHTLRLEKSGYTACKPCLGVGCSSGAQAKPCQFTATIVKGQVVTYEVAMVKTFPVTILSSPSGAVIELDGASVGAGRVRVQQSQSQAGTKAKKIRGGNMIDRMLEELKRANAAKWR